MLWSPECMCGRLEIWKFKDFHFELIVKGTFKKNTFLFRPTCLPPCMPFNTSANLSKGSFFLLCPCWQVRDQLGIILAGSSKVRRGMELPFPRRRKSRPAGRSRERWRWRGYVWRGGDPSYTRPALLSGKVWHGGLVPGQGLWKGWRSSLWGPDCGEHVGELEEENLRLGGELV